MLFKDDISPLLRIAFPLILTGLLQSSTWFFETVFLARLGPDILAAGSLVSWAFGTMVVILFGTLSSINILVAHKHGAHDEEGIYLVVRDGFWLALLLSIPLIFLFWNMSPIFLVFGQSPKVAMLAQAYLHAMAWGILPNIVMIAMLEVTLGLGQTRLILAFTILTVTLSIFFSFVLIFGKLGFPALGIAGAGWGVTTSNWISVIALGIYVLWSSSFRNYFRYLFIPSYPKYLLELIQVGVPMGLMYCIEVAFFFALSLIMGSFGSIMLAANQIALQYLGSLMSVIFSMAQAITVRMGHLIGAGNKASALRSGYIGIILSGAFMLLVAFVCWFAPTLLISIDFDVHQAHNAELVMVTTQILAVGALFQMLEAVRISYFGALRALKDTRFTLFVSIISFWGIALPIGYYLATRLAFGGVGLWWGMVIGAGFSVLVLVLRLRVKIG